MKTLRLFLGTLGALALLLALAAPTPAVAGTITLKYSDHDPPGGMRTDFVKKVWLAEIEKQTGGKVKIQDFIGGSLLSSKEILKGVGDNVAQMGFMYPGHYPGELPAYTIYKLFPRGPSKFKSMVWLYRKVQDQIPEFQADMKRANQMTLLYTAGLPGAFTSTKPLRSIDDLKGNKWRAGDKWGLRFLQNAGAVPVSVPWGDVYMAMQTRTIDGCFTNYDGLHLMKFDEVGQNLMVSKELWYQMPFIHNINLKTWDELPADVRDGLLKASRIAEEQFAQVYDEAFDKILATQKARKYKVAVMSKQDIAKWENAAELAKMQEQWVQEAKGAGMANAAGVLAKLRELHAQAMEMEK
jgi:TRAP-type C4-dicarboxylate transport system substrate-binding protein